MLIENTSYTFTVDRVWVLIVAALLVLLAVSALGFWRALGRSPDCPAAGPDGAGWLDAVKDWLGIRNAGWAGTLILAAVMVAFALLFVMAVIASFLLIGTVIVGSEASGTQSLGLGALLVALLGAPFLIWRSVVAQKTLDTTMHGQVTQRINEAVAALGTEKVVKFDFMEGDKLVTRERSEPNMEVRIGAILALERIARENLVFHVQIMNILCSYIRENSPAKDTVACVEPDMLEAECASGMAPDDLDGFRSTYQAALRRHVGGLITRIDIQAAIEVIGRRSSVQMSREGAWPDPNGSLRRPFDMGFPEFPTLPTSEPASTYTSWLSSFLKARDEASALVDTMNAFAGFRISLEYSNLQGYRFDGLNFSGADLTGALLDGASFDQVDMQGVNLFGARLRGAKFSDSNLNGANMSEANLFGVAMFAAEVNSADLTEARMPFSILKDSTFCAAGFWGAFLAGAQLYFCRAEFARLNGVSLIGASLKEVEFSAAELERADMIGSDVRRVNFWSASLRGAKLDGSTKISIDTLNGAGAAGVDWRSGMLSADHVVGMFGDASTRLKFDRPKCWPTIVLVRNWPEDYSPWHIEFKRWQSNPDAYEWSERRQYYTPDGKLNPDNLPPELRR